MTHYFKILILATCLLGGLSLHIHAQRLEYDVEFVTNFDNREYHTQHDHSQTIFGTRLTPTIGVSFQDSLGGNHRLMAGVSYIQPFGSNWKDAHVHPTIYYAFRKSWPTSSTSHSQSSLPLEGRRGSSLTASFGFIPYSHLMRRLPKFLMSDSLYFSYPNIQGALIQYTNQRGFVEAFCDWRGMPIGPVREAFRIVIDGEGRYKMFRAGGHVQLNHLANPGDLPLTGVCDDAYAHPYIGVDASHLTPLDSLRFDVGYLFGYQCNRETDVLHVAQGLTAQFTLRWRWIELDDQFYWGENQMPFYPTLGSILNQGEPFYQNRLYNSAELRFRVLRRDFAQIYLAWNLIYTQGEPLSHQQRVVLRFDLSRSTLSSFSSRSL